MNPHRIQPSNRGAVLVVAMVLAIVIAIALGSYVTMSLTALHQSQRSYLANEAMNVTEAGLEQALWAFNRKADDDANAWSKFTLAGIEATGTFSSFELSQNATAQVKVYVKNYNSTGIPVPLIVAKATVTPANGSPLTKMVETELKRRSRYRGLIVRDRINFNGNFASVDSWNSDPDNNPATPNVAYSTDPSIRHSNALVAATAVASKIDLSNGDIFGYVSIGSDTISSIDLGKNGRVGDFDQPLGTLDTDRIVTNFTMDLPLPEAPKVDPAEIINWTKDGGIMTGSVTLPVPGDLPASDGVYYYRAAAISEVGDTTNILQIGSQDVADTDYKVVILLTAGSGTSAFTTGGSGGGVVIAQGDSLAVYTTGDIKLAGKGVANSNVDAYTFRLYGTNTTPGVQEIDITGNGDLRGVVDAPNAEVTMRGNGTIMGSVVAHTATIDGDTAFHFDEALLNKGDKYFKVGKWLELVTPADRAKYATQLSF